MKYFHISAVFDLVESPYWLADFRKRFDVGWTHHVTLKNPTAIENEKVGQMKSKLVELIKASNLERGGTKIIFDDLKINLTSSGYCIMVMSRKATRQINVLQSKLHKDFSKYGKYAKPEYEEFEINFNPHLTIGRHLNEEKLKQAKEFLGGKISLVGKLKEIVLIVVDEPTDENWTNEKNKTHFSV